MLLGKELAVLLMSPCLQATSSAAEPSSASLQLGSHRQKCLDDTLSGPFCLEKVPEMKFLTVYLVVPAVSAAPGGN